MLKLLSDGAKAWPAALALFGVASIGWTAHTFAAEQAVLPDRLARQESALDSVRSRLDTTAMQVRELAEGQRQVVQRMDRLICLLEADFRGTSFIVCER